MIDVHKRVWDFLQEDSWLSFVVTLLLAFVIIKFVFFPGLSLVTGTSLPLVIVESCSMYHAGTPLSSFDNWWENHESKYSKHVINKLDFQNFIFKNGFNKGDILFIIKAKPEKLKVGDVIIFKAINKDIIHRVIDIRQKDGGYIFSTMGDNVGTVQYFEKTIYENQLVGKAVFRIAPFVGWAKLVAADVWYKIFPGTSNYIKDGLCK